MVTDPVIIPDKLLIWTINELTTWRDTHDQTDELGRSQANRIDRLIVQIKKRRDLSPHRRRAD